MSFETHAMIIHWPIYKAACNMVEKIEIRGYVKLHITIKY